MPRFIETCRPVWAEASISTPLQTVNIFTSQLLIQDVYLYFFLNIVLGFVSFNNPDSAQSAIDGMDKYQIGRKRLLVALNKERKVGSRAAPVNNDSLG